MSIQAGIDVQDSYFQQIGVEDQVPDSICQPGTEIPDFNPEKRCYWEFSIPCTCDFDPSKNFRALEALPDEKTNESEFGVEEARKPQLGPGHDCKEESKWVDVHSVSVDQCAVGIFGVFDQNPVALESQDGETVSFSVKQVWRGGTYSAGDTDEKSLRE